TRSPGNLARSVMISSVIASVRSSCSGTPERFSKGSTAIDEIRGVAEAAADVGCQRGSSVPGNAQGCQDSYRRENAITGTLRFKYEAHPFKTSVEFSEFATFVLLGCTLDREYESVAAPAHSFYELWPRSGVL